MNIEYIKDQIQTTPALVLDMVEMHQCLQRLGKLHQESGCQILYSIKAMPLESVLAFAKPYVHGFSVSSLFEARFADQILAGQGLLHLTTPGISQHEMQELASLCSHLSCNSITQYQQFAGLTNSSATLGIRVNPKLSFTDDSRYDPCRRYSKLGVDLNDLLNTELVNQISGLHFHTVYSMLDLMPLHLTLDKLQQIIGNKFKNLTWLNLGGGYLFNEIDDYHALSQRIIGLMDEYNLDVFIEPGNAIVGKAGYLVATVIDTFNSDGKAIAILDTSVNHIPQVFEYQRQPEVYNHNPNGMYPVILAGCTCLAGDLFGEYRFEQPVSLGDKVIIQNVGAYSLVKANRFNGYNLPDIYLAEQGQLKRVKHHSYYEYKHFWSVS